MMDINSGEILLFKAVLLQAAQDAFLIRSPTSGQSRLNRESALCFLSGGEDLSTVCDFAGVDYAAVRRIAADSETSSSNKYMKVKELLKA